MTTQKDFDCVAFKRQAQQRLKDEYEARKSEFRSYIEFLRRKVEEDDWSREMVKRFER